MTRRDLAATLLLALLPVWLLAGCTGDDGAMDDDDPRQALEQQRRDARELAVEVLDLVEEALPGRRSRVSGDFRGCESGGLEHFRSFGYRLDARVDAAEGADRPYATRLRRALEERGLEARTVRRPGTTLLRADRGEVGVLLTERPGAGDFVLVAVSGPCVDVPEEQSGAWLRRTDEEPLPGD